MQNREGSVLHTQKEEDRQEITVALHPQTIRRLDALARRSGRTRSGMISLILNAALLIIHGSDPLKPQ